MENKEKRIKISEAKLKQMVNEAIMEEVYSTREEKMLRSVIRESVRQQLSEGNKPFGPDYTIGDYNTITGDKGIDLSTSYDWIASEPWWKQLMHNWILSHEADLRFKKSATEIEVFIIKKLGMLIKSFFVKKDTVKVKKTIEFSYRIPSDRELIKKMDNDSIEFGQEVVSKEIDFAVDSIKPDTTYKQFHDTIISIDGKNLVKTAPVKKEEPDYSKQNISNALDSIDEGMISAGVNAVNKLIPYLEKSARILGFDANQINPETKQKILSAAQKYIDEAEAYESKGDAAVEKYIADLDKKASMAKSQKHSASMYVVYKMAAMYLRVVKVPAVGMAAMRAPIVKPVADKTIGAAQSFGNGVMQGVQNGEGPIGSLGYGIMAVDKYLAPMFRKLMILVFGKIGENTPKGQRVKQLEPQFNADQDIRDRYRRLAEKEGAERAVMEMRPAIEAITPDSTFEEIKAKAIQDMDIKLQQLK